MSPGGIFAFFKLHPPVRPSSAPDPPNLRRLCAGAKCKIKGLGLQLTPPQKNATLGAQNAPTGFLLGFRPHVATPPDFSARPSQAEGLTPELQLQLFVGLNGLRGIGMGAAS